MGTAIARGVLRWSLVGTCVVPGARLARDHPLHTTVTTLSLDTKTGTVTAEMRIFTDDLAKAVAHVARPPSSDSAALAYVRERFRITSADGHRTFLATCGVRESADLRWICLRAALPGGVAGIRIADAVLMDVYPDQVNIVMATNASVLFVRGDREKEIR